MINLDKLSDFELRERAKTLNDSLTRLRKYGTEEYTEEVEADLELVHEERERRYMEHQNDPEQWKI